MNSPEPIPTHPTALPQSSDARARSLRRPAAVLVIDLVRHSTREKEEIDWIQRTLQDSLESALGTLLLDGVQLKYTGDGYVCTFLGDASVRAIDFINTGIPDLQRKLATRQQQFRAGLDFGLVHLKQNRLTGSQEHFDEPGIRAARLEHAAQPGQILCTETVHAIFSPYYKANFPGQRLSVEAKDRVLTAYELIPQDYSAVRRGLFEYLFGRFAGPTPATRNVNCRILLVEDDAGIRDIFARRLRKRLGAEVGSACDGVEGLASFEKGPFDVVLADVLMPLMAGDEMAVRMLSINPKTIIFLVTACALQEDIAKFEQKVLDAGGFGCFYKPIDFSELVKEILAALNPSIAAAFHGLGVLSTRPGRLKNVLRGIAGKVQGLFTGTTSGGDIVASLAAHKAKHLIGEFLEAARPGEDILEKAELVLAHLSFLRRLVETSHVAAGQPFDTFLEQYAGDLRKEHEKLEFDVRVEPAALEVIAGFEFDKLLLLCVCELIDNAVAALGASGNIWVEVGYQMTKRRLRVVVKDNGPGISAEIAKRMFELGFSTKGSGRGYGLPLVRESVDRMQGELRYESENGARFSIALSIRAAGTDTLAEQ